MDAVTEKAFRLEEATIDDLHGAIKAGRTTVAAVVQHYLTRVRAYNGNGTSPNSNVIKAKTKNR